MSIELFTQTIKEARRDALVSNYLAVHDFGSYQDSINDSEDLYEYLLLDTKISDLVVTTPMAEAISSLQLCIHRAIEGYDGTLSTNANNYFTQDAFLYNWDQYNKRYSTWAGKEKLRFYAGNYVDPTLRTNKTALFSVLEESLQQGKLTTELVETALNRYVADYDKYAKINQLYLGQGNDDATILYITGELNGQYYWREVRRDSQGKPIYWGEWQQLPFPINDPINNAVVVRFDPMKSSIVCEWKENERQQDNQDPNEASNLVEVMRTYAYSINKEWAVDVNNLAYDVVSTRPGETTVTSINVALNTWSYVINFGSAFTEGSFFISENHIEITCTDGTDGSSNGNSCYNDNLSERVEPGQTKTFILTEPFTIKRCASNDVYSGGEYTLSERISYGYIQKSSSGHLMAYSNDGFALFQVDPPSGSLSELLKKDVSSLFDYSQQKGFADSGTWRWVDDNSHGWDVGGDGFSGPYGLYLREVFFHVPFLIASRFTTEQRFEEAETWYKSLFSSAGYRGVDGSILNNDAGTEARYWNCYPLEQDAEWDAFADMPSTVDPDVIALADPMHYKLSIFLHTLELLLARGDTCYRQLERDTLTEAKMYYIQAQQLLGPRPDIHMTNSWSNPTLSTEAGLINSPTTRDGTSLTFTQWLQGRDANEMGDGDFLPPYNDVLLEYWDKIEVRLYNLRHNLSLDGQPLNLPLYATPVDPESLHRQQGSGDGVEGDVVPSDNSNTGWRYPLLAEHARSAVAQLTQFGNSLLSALERRDSEQMTLLLQTQQIAVLQQQQTIAQKSLESLHASLNGLQAGLNSAQMRQKHYQSLIDRDLSAAEISGLTGRSTAIGFNSAAIGLQISAGALSVLPNTFGLACGGGDYGAPVWASVQATQTLAQVSEQAAAISEITANYQRRKEDWLLQRDLAIDDVKQMTAQIDSLNEQITMQQKQIALVETESAHTQAQYDLQVSRFTGQTLYNWMTGRLSSLYYQLYDATVPVCLQARNALTQELGEDKADGLFNTAVWNDLYQGLLAGEGLTTELQKLDNVWLQHSAQGLEAIRTISIAAVRGEASGNLSDAIGDVLEGTLDTADNGTLVQDNTNHIFSATLDMSLLNLDNDYGSVSTDKGFFIKNIAVTLPTLLGPYQDIAATLSDQHGNIATLSHGMQDNGRFVTSFEDSRFLPFEGNDPRSTMLMLAIYNVQEEEATDTPNQRLKVENLSDIIFHLHYIMR